MPQEGFRSAIYRSLATCNDPKGVVTCRPIRRPHKTEEAAMMSQRRRKASEEVNSPASFQLAEVSRGARKLNETIERWSGGDRGGGSKDMAKELLRGAMDLQGSLVMLGKLQEASKFMARLKHGETSPDDQKPRLSFGGDSTEELKKVIRESLLVKQRKKGLDLESASNSTTTTISHESPLPAKGPNLIAKLMGLGDYPSAEKPKRPVSDIDTITRPRRERQSLREILESVRFEGALRSSDDDPLSDEGLPPIVLMKPMRVPKRDYDDDDDDPLCISREMLMKLRESKELRPDIEPVKAARVAKAKPKANSSPVVKPPRASSSARNEAAEKRGDKVQIKVHRKSPEEKKTRSEGQAIDKRNSVKTRKTSSEANASKSQNIPGRRQSLSPNRPSTVKRGDQIASSNQKKKSCVKKENPAKKKSTAVKIVVVDEISRVSTNPKSQEEDLGLSESKIEDVTPHRILCEATPSTTPCLNREESAEEEEEAPTDTINDKRFEPESNLKAFLLSSLSFRNRADELFDLDFNASQISLSNPSSESDEFDDLRRIAGSLLVDCAFELVERLSLRISQSLIRRRISMETVAEEVCDEIDALRSYCSGGGLAAVECVYAMLERDVMTCGGGMWDHGWRTAGDLPEEAERVVADVEKLVLSGLIDEVFFC